MNKIGLFQFSQESAFPKMNKDESNRQFMTCSGDMYILIWDLLKPEQEAEGGAQQVQAMQDEVNTYSKKEKKKITYSVANHFYLLGGTTKSKTKNFNLGPFESQKYNGTR